jgi:hypothetical protein
MFAAAAQHRPQDTHTKALQINLDARRYGTFAEIGAGHVCRPRLQSMLDHEHQLNLDRLGETAAMFDPTSAASQTGFAR